MFINCPFEQILKRRYHQIISLYLLIFHFNLKTHPTWGTTLGNLRKSTPGAINQVTPGGMLERGTWRVQVFRELAESDVPVLPTKTGDFMGISCGLSHPKWNYDGYNIG